MTTLRHGYTTGTCATAAATAAVQCLLGQKPCDPVSVSLPGQKQAHIPLADVGRKGDQAMAAVIKDAGDDPDVTDGCRVVVTVSWRSDAQIELLAGEGVGWVTQPGLVVQPGQPAINPVPRTMLCAAVQRLTGRGVRLEVSIPGGAALAKETFNGRLGIRGGLSILGTSGIVRPLSLAAIRKSLYLCLQVAQAAGVRAPVLVPGHIGEKAAGRHFRLPEYGVITVGNEWGFLLRCLRAGAWQNLLIVGHPGKLAKLPQGHWNTHSSSSPSPLAAVTALADSLGLGPLAPVPTLEGVFQHLPEPRRGVLAEALANQIAQAVAVKLQHRIPVAVALVNMTGELLGAHGDLRAWR